MKHFTIVLEVPDVLDPQEVAEIMAQNFYDMNKDTDDLGPHMGSIAVCWD